MSAIARHKAAWAKANGEATTAAKPQRQAPTGDDAVWAAACKHDWDALKAIPDHAERNRLKPAMIDKYREYLDQWIFTHRRDPQQNDVLVRNLIWATDAQQWQYARNLADACALTGQVMTLMERTCCTFFTDSIVQAIEKGVTDNNIFGIAGTIPGRVETDPQWAINHIAQAKLYRALAKHEKDNDPVSALRYATAAHTLYPNVGVKTLMEQLKTVVDGENSAPSGVSATPPPRASGKPAEEAGHSSPANDPAGDAAKPVFLDS